MRQNQGYNLLEVMIVAALIGIMGTTSVWVYKGYKARSDVAKAKAEVLKVVQAASVYMANNLNNRPTTFTQLATVDGAYVETNSAGGSSRRVREVELLSPTQLKVGEMYVVSFGACPSSQSSIDGCVRVEARRTSAGNARDQQACDGDTGCLYPRLWAETLGRQCLQSGCEQ